MVSTSPASEVAPEEKRTGYFSNTFPHDVWMESQGIPIHRGYYVADLRTVELGWWEARQTMAAFIQLRGQAGISEARVSEVPAGKSTEPVHLGIDEVVYVLQGRGLTHIWGADGKKKTFEWHDRSLFLLPHNAHHQFVNMSGGQPVRLLHYNYMPIALSVQDPSFYLQNPPELASVDPVGSLYSAARVTAQDKDAGTEGRGASNLWYGNLFPDMAAWDKLDQLAHRGAGGHRVQVQFAGSQMSCHMSVFPPRTYKKAHRHGPGRVIVIPAGEGYSILWEEGQEKIVAPWHEGSMFVPPEKWFHQHFNVGSEPARYLALHPLRQFYGHAEKVEDAARDTIEYVNEDRFIREKFEAELGKRGLATAMPEEAYKNRAYQWAYGA